MKILKSLGVFTGIIFLLCVVCAFALIIELKEIKKTEINDVVPSTLSDGKYYGKTGFLFRSNKLKIGEGYTKNIGFGTVHATILM